jgi:hypothetical protein
MKVANSEIVGLGGDCSMDLFPSISPTAGTFPDNFTFNVLIKAFSDINKGAETAVFELFKPRFFPFEEVFEGDTAAGIPPTNILESVLRDLMDF